MAQTKKITFLKSWGSPLDGSIIRSGSTLDFPLFWAEKFVKEGVAKLAETSDADAKKKAKK